MKGFQKPTNSFNLKKSAITATSATKPKSMKSPTKVTPMKKRQSVVDPKCLTQNININTTLRSR